MDCQIFICYHKEYPFISNDMLCPIHVGKACSDRELSILTDNQNENISYKNKHFCELTATYWIWKNVKADYVGLFHYRRLLNFRHNRKYAYYKNIDLDKYGLTSEFIKPLLREYDVILPKKYIFKNSIYNHYAKSHILNDMDITLEVIKEKYPEMYEFANEIINNHTSSYIANMLISSKQFFDKYSEWLFDILFEVENRIQVDVETRDIYQQRVYGFLSERLMTVYIEYLKSTQNIKIKELPMLFLEEDKKKVRKNNFKHIKRILLKNIGLGKKVWDI